MTCDAEWRSLTISSSAFVGSFAASISSWVVGMWRATVSGARRRTSGASARAERRTPASNMARRIGLAVACAACAPQHCRSVALAARAPAAFQLWRQDDDRALC